MLVSPSLSQCKALDVRSMYECIHINPYRLSILIQHERNIPGFPCSPEGKIVADKVTHTLGQNEAYIETTASGLCGTDEYYLRTSQALGTRVWVLSRHWVLRCVCQGWGSGGIGDTHSICALA